MATAFREFEVCMHTMGLEDGLSLLPWLLDTSS